MNNMPSRQQYWWVDGDPQQPAFGTLGFYLALMDDLITIHWEDVTGYIDTEERWSELDELMDGLCSDIPKFLLTTQLDTEQVEHILSCVSNCKVCGPTMEQECTRLWTEVMVAEGRE